MNKKYTINLTIGDWSGDGHCEKNVVTIISNIRKEGVEVAYELGCKKTGIDPYKDMCNDFSDDTISRDTLEKLKKHGFNPDYELEKYGVGYTMSTDVYLDIWLFTVKCGLPQFEYEIVDVDNINVGGYGLFPG